MTPYLFAHPLSSYCWKVLIAFWETETEFEYKHLEIPANAAAWAEAWPIKRMPLLVDGEAIIPEATIIIEYLQHHYPGHRRMIPLESAESIHVRLLDRLSDNYLMSPTQTIVFDRARLEPDRDPIAVKKAREMLDTAYTWWDDHMTGREWAADQFGLADCATAPSLFYADWVHPIPAPRHALRAYRQRLLARPSVARAVNEARPFRSSFPFGDPGRD